MYWCINAAWCIHHVTFLRFYLIVIFVHTFFKTCMQQNNNYILASKRTRLTYFIANSSCILGVSYITNNETIAKVLSYNYFLCLIWYCFRSHVFSYIKKLSFFCPYLVCYWLIIFYFAALSAYRYVPQCVLGIFFSNFISNCFVDHWHFICV